MSDLPVPRIYEPAVVTLARVVHALRTAQATVEDAAEATLRAYEIISRIPNDVQPRHQWQTQDLSALDHFSETAYEALLTALQESQDVRDADAPPYDTSQPVDYRGDFKPDLVQLLTQLQTDANQSGEVQSLSQETLEQLLQESIELMADTDQDVGDMGSLAQTLMQHYGAPVSTPAPEQGHRPQLVNDE